MQMQIFIHLCPFCAYSSRFLALTQLYYNALVPISTTSHRGRSMKYGVISMKHLTEDLTDWTWLYTAGRYESYAEGRQNHV